MPILTLNTQDDAADVSTSLDVQIEFANSDDPFRPTGPLRISAEAGDLVDCDAASTCASDTDKLDLFDQEHSLESFVYDVSVIIRYLDPVVLMTDLESHLKSLGLQWDRIICPTFLVCTASDTSPETREFNFGYACVSFATVDEALFFNFLINSQGSVEVNVDQPIHDDDDSDFDVQLIKLVVTVVAPNIGSRYCTMTFESTLHDVLSTYGDIVSLARIPGRSGDDFEVTLVTDKSSQFVLAEIARRNQHTNSTDILFFADLVDQETAVMTDDSSRDGGNTLIHPLA